MIHVGRSVGWAAASALVTAVLGGCRENVTERSPEDVGVVLHPGDCLLDLPPDVLQLVDYPETNLPPTLSALAREPMLRCVTPELNGWIRHGAIPRDLRAPEGRGLLYWDVDPGIRLPSRDARVHVRRAGRRLAPWSNDTFAADARDAAFWRAGPQRVGALMAETPEGLSLEYPSRPADLFGRVERRWPLGAGRATRPSPTPPVTELRDAFELGEVWRDGLLVPAPGRWQVDVDHLGADALHLSVGVLDHGHVVEDDVVRAQRPAGDGVTFAIEVRGTKDSNTVRVWERTVLPPHIGRRWLDATVDLEPWSGQACRLTFLTEPGRADDRSFDYAVWSGLRVHGRDATPPTRPHVIYLDLDTLRADRLSAYGHSRATSPRLDAWAAKHAVLYEEHTANASWTLPSTASMLTGLTVRQHGVRTYSQVLGRETPTLATWLRQAGYETYAIAEGGYVLPTYGFGRGFDIADHTRRRDPDWRDALRWIAGRRSERPFFLFLHTYFVHAPYWWNTRFVDPNYDGPLLGQEIHYGNVIEPYKRGALSLTEDDFDCIAALYDGMIHELDRRVGAFLAALDTLLDGEPYVVVINSDHGDEFGEHGGLNHGQSLFEELLRVPLMVRFPAGHGPPPGSRVTAPTSNLDIVPTLLALAGVDVGPNAERFTGRVLHQALLDAQHLRVGEHTRGATSVQQRTEKLIDGAYEPSRDDEPEVRLFDLATDPHEQLDLAPTSADRVQALREALAAWNDRFPPVERAAAPPATLSAEERQRLRDLGYLEEDDGDAPNDR